MIEPDLQAIIDALNHKQYAQSMTLPALDSVPLTEAEKEVVAAYQPDRQLVVYGTLAPGRPNYKVVEPIGGTWQTGTIQGLLARAGWGAELGYYGFVATPESGHDTIAVHVLSSDDLGRHWSRLDTFEGDEYQRILVPVALDNGQISVGHLYALREASQ